MRDQELNSNLNNAQLLEAFWINMTRVIEEETKNSIVRKYFSKAEEIKKLEGGDIYSSLVELHSHRALNIERWSLQQQTQRKDLETDLSELPGILLLAIWESLFLK